MATELQKGLAEAIVENIKKPRRKRKNKKELLVSAGYSEVTAEASPSRTLNQKGVKEALAEYGLTEGLITKALVEDINAKPKNRLGEMRLGAEILGMNAKENSEGNKTLILVVSGESAQRYNVQPHGITKDGSN